MGIELHGYVEVGYPGYWAGVVSVGALLSRSDDLFACLFGVCNHASFEPLFAERGIPEDASEETLRLLSECESESFGQTHVGYLEIQRIDRGLTGSRVDQRLRVYEVLVDGSERFVGKVGNMGPNDAPIRKSIAETGVAEWEGRLYRLSKATVGEALDHGGWRTAMRLMDVLAEDFAGRVRLVVWFT